MKITLLDIEIDEVWNPVMVTLLNVEVGRFNGSLLHFDRRSFFWDLFYVVGINAYRKT